MSKRNWVCFDCRSAIRREADIAKAVVCATCSKPLVNLGYQIPIPAVGDVLGIERTNLHKRMKALGLNRE